ncbi:MAG: outer membrane protein assembly factor BamA [Chlamydiota bacterium]|nr:outer membrane protein assembly factor BamA [Chlamydiota bacterium]
MKNHPFSTKTLISFLFSFMMIVPVFGQDEGESVQKVDVKGNHRVNESYVLSQVKAAPGVTFNRTLLDDDLKRLYATGYFSDVKIDIDTVPGGVAVTFIVVEKPIVKEISIDGAKKIKEKTIKKAMKLKTDDILDESVLVQDMEAIKNLYLEKGYTKSQVEYRINVDEKIGHAIVIISIAEGKKIQIKEIHFVGNTVFTDKKLRKAMKTKRKWFLGGGIFDSDKFEDDKLRILDLYQSKGYIDAKIEDLQITYAAPEEMIITITLTEGGTYPVGAIVIQGNRVYPTEEISHQITLQKGNIFIPAELRKSANGVRDYYLSRGYVDASVRPEVIFNEESAALDIIFSIIENELSYIDEIKIEGNTKTKDIVIRRELAVRPGEIFDGVRVRRSQERLLNLGYFQSVYMDIEPTDVADQKNLLVKVEETKTGELGFGAGFSSIDKLIGFVEVTQKNFDWANFPSFSGDGQKLRVRAQFGSKRQDYILSWTEPWLFDRPISFGFDVYRRNRRYLSDLYDEVRTGGDLRLGKRLAEFIRADLAYRFERVTIDDVDDNASDLIKAEAGTFDVSSIELGLTRDTRNHPLSPSRGMRNRIAAEMAGGVLGFDRDFYKLSTNHSLHIPLPLDLILRFSVQAGIVDSFGDTENVPLFERFFLGGGNTIRGFDFREVGPKDSTGEPIGGQSMIAGTAELTFPIWGILRGAVFYDTGNVYEDYAQFDLGDLRAGAGLGVRIKLPIGPIRIDYGWPIDRDEFTDGGGRFDFNIGYSF